VYRADVDEPRDDSDLDIVILPWNEGLCSGDSANWPLGAAKVRLIE
jgi:hypothetical protein